VTRFMIAIAPTVLFDARARMVSVLSLLQDGQRNCTCALNHRFSIRQKG